MNEKTKESIKKIITCKELYYFITIILFIITYYINLRTELEENNIEDMSVLRNFLIISIISATIIMILILISKKMYSKIKPHFVYFIIALILGGMYIFFIPLCAQSDEPAHIFRTIQIANGEFISPIEGNEYRSNVPKSIIDLVSVNTKGKTPEYKRYSDIEEMKDIKFDKDETTKIRILSGSYNPISYLPQTIGVKIGMMLNLNPYYFAMLGRITGLLITISMFSFAIYKLPSHKLLASIMLLSPVALSYAASFSADSMTLASIFILVSYVLYFRNTKNKIKNYEYLILAILTYVVAVSKIAYLPMIGTLLLIPKECYKTKKSKWIITILLLIFGTISTLSWLKINNVNIMQENDTFKNVWIYKNPFGYLIVLFRTTMESGTGYIENMFAGHYLCHNQVHPPELISLIYIGIVVASFFSDENKEKASLLQKTIVVLIGFVVYALVSAAIYTANCVEKSLVIIGVQGRYLLPISTLAVFLGDYKKNNIEKSTLVSLALIVNFTVYLTMMNTFFVQLEK